MKKIFLLLLAVSVINHVIAQGCATCGKTSATMGNGSDTGVHCSISLGPAEYGQSAGHLILNASVPDASLFTPAALTISQTDRTDVVVFTTNEIVTNSFTFMEVSNQAVFTTNSLYFTNYDGGDPATLTTNYTTNTYVNVSIVTTTNAITTLTEITNAAIRQVIAPQSVADIPPPQTANGYAINFYFPSQITGTNADGTCQLSGTPFITWIITNSSPPGIDQLQISQIGNVPDYGLMKQWSYDYSTNSQAWSVESLGGIVQEDILTTNLSQNSSAIINTLQSPGGAVVQQTEMVYSNFSWGTAPIQVLAGSASAPEVTTYSYYSSSYVSLLQEVINPDGSWQYYNSYDGNGNPLSVYSSYGDTSSQDGGDFYGEKFRETDYTYNPTNAGVSTSGDDGTFYPNTARLTVQKIQGIEVARQYTVFPSAGVRLDIQCTVTQSLWNASGNLITTNLFYTNGPNQYSLEAVVRPDDTMSTYNYITNGNYQTNITVTGQADPTYSYIVDGVSNQTVLNQWGYSVADASWDVKSGLLLSQDIYGNFDVYGRPQQVIHLDGTTENTEYACCGLDETIDRDGVLTQYLYDPSKRQVGYEKVYNGNPIAYSNVLDAAGRTVASVRIGYDNSSTITSQSAFDLAGELIAQTNALDGATFYTRTTNSATGGLILSTVNPDGGVVTNFYYVDGTLKETIGTAVHGQVYGYGITNLSGNICTYTVVTNLNSSGGLSSEWTKTFTDIAGRNVETLYADGHYSQSFYNAQGQLSKQVDPDGVVTLYEYNAKGELAYTAIDMNQNGIIDFSGSDRITQTTNDVTTDHDTTVTRSRTYQWLNGQSTGTLISSSETSANGLNAWQTQYRDTSTPVTTQSLTVPGTSRMVTSIMPDGSYTVNDYSYGWLVSSTHHDSTGAQIGGTTYGYDADGRQNTMTDARNGTTTLIFNNADLVATNTTPNPGGGSPEVTTTLYDGMLRATNVMQPDGTVVNSAYLLTGELGLQYGSRTYPVAYTYDYAGRMQTMTNWSGFNTGAGPRVTTWTYDSQRGLLTGKTYAGNTAGPSYTYTGAARLASRTWARGITATYSYDTSGSLTNVSYSDGVTPRVGYVYDRLGRQTNVLWNGITDIMSYNLANQLLGESFSGGTLNGLTVTNNYDSDLRRTTLTALSASSQLLSDTYGYDNASRLSTVTDANDNSANYTYLANSPLVSQIVFKQNGTTRMTTTKQYDYLNRLTQISSAPSASYVLPLTFNYNYDPANQRTKDTLADGSYWVYGYDSLGQVTNACKFFSSGTPVPGQQFDYTFDTIGNRTQTMAGGDTNAANLRVANYYANNLNQLTNRDVPAYVDIIGASIFTNVVTVNGQVAYRNQEYYRQQLAVNNTNAPLWTNIVVSGGQTVTGNVYVAQEPEVFKYDADGNLTNDGHWAYTWDGENRLTKMTVNTNVGPQYKLTFAYDYQGRRIQKIVATNGVGIYTNNFLYDGWNLVAVLSSSLSLSNSFVWGTDLSGSAQDAGGVGGLLEATYYGSVETNCFPVYDGNGNVTALINAADGTLAANYDYGAYGEVIRLTGVMAKHNPLRFSTKFDDDESDLLYYGYRFYKPATGNWLNYDPNEEKGGFNLDGFVNEDPINRIDYIGLCCGPDVTQDLKDTLLDAQRQFDAASPLKLKLAQHDLFEQSGWDTLLITSKNLAGPCGQSGSCNNTVTVNGVCYLSWEVNYVLFGRMCSLFNISEGKMEAAVVAQKIGKIITRRGYDYQMRGALSWAIAGYVGWPNSEAPYSDIKGCQPCSYVYPKSLFWWYDGPLRGGQANQ